MPGAVVKKGGAMGVEDFSRLQMPAASVAERIHHDCHLLVWQVLGSTEFLLDGEPYATARGQALWVPLGVRHSLVTAPGAVLFPLLIRPSLAGKWLRSPALIAVDRDLQRALLALTQQRNSIIRVDVDLERQVLAMLQGRPVLPSRLPMPRNSVAAARVAGVLRNDPGDRRSVAELAAVAAVSVSTLERRFRVATGMTLREWRLRNRMESAGLLLRERNSIAVVASRVGYSSVSAFHRTFGRHFGMTPREYAMRFEEIFEASVGSESP